MPKERDVTTGSGPEPPAATAHGGEYREIPVDAVAPSPLNRRYAGDEDQRVLSLAAELAERGLLHPINVRVMPGDRYEIICGEGRWRAFRCNGRATIPALVHDCDEITAHIMRLSENIHRHDLEPLDEGEGVAALLELHHGDVKEVSSRVGWGESWVRRRAQLVKLSPAWRAEIAKSDTQYPHIRDKVMHLEEIAALPAETQDALLANGTLQFKRSAAELRRAIALWMRRLDSKPWTYEFDKKTYSGSSGRRCEACLKRTGRKDGGLFDELVEASSEMLKGDKSELCLDPACWEQKTVRFVLAQLDENPGAYLLADGYVDSRKEEELYGQKILPHWKYSECAGNRATPEGFTIEARGVFACGGRIGGVVDIMDAMDQADDAERAARMARAKKENEKNAACAASIEKAVNEVLPRETPDMDAPELLRLALWFGLSCHAYAENDDVEGLAWRSLRHDVADEIAEIVKCGLQTPEDEHGEARNTIMAMVIERLALDLDSVRARAEEILHAPAD